MLTSEITWPGWLCLAFGLIIFSLLLYVVFVSFREQEPRAGRWALAFSMILPLPYVCVALIDYSFVQIILLSTTLILMLILFFPAKMRPENEILPESRIDERDIMFSRNLLENDTDRYTRYYKENPKKKTLDDQFRKNPGLMSKKSLHYHPFHFSVAEANFATVKAFHPMLDKKPSAAQPVAVHAKEISSFIKKWALKLGSVSVGITELKDYHLYSHVGRGENYGENVTLNHKYAIAITVEMDKYMMDHAPFGPMIMESSQQYLNSGTIAIQIAAFILNLGYPARAHIDGNYRVVCPLVARDAGLGEIGRMGLLMTPELGPRVRIAVVTTDLPLVPDIRKPDPSVIEFCSKCKKCANVCPGRAISFDNRREIDGIRRWQINSEACFTLWTKMGTDCGRCVTVCPYSHPNNLMHNIVRKAVRNSSRFRLFALKMDDLFYGRKPTPVKPDGWLISKNLSHAATQRRSV